MLCQELNLLQAIVTFWNTASYDGIGGDQKSVQSFPIFQARIADGLADAGPIWEDVTRVQPEQLGESTGLLAGFPCQAGFTELASSQI